MSSPVMQIIKCSFATGGLIAPSVTGKIAFRLFCRTENPNRLTPRAAGVIEGAVDFMRQARRHCLTTEYGDIVAHEFSDWNARRDGPAVLVLHGWRSRTEHMKGLVEALVRRGFRVVALDLPGHGRSRGRRLNMAMAVSAVHAASLWLGPFETVVGHSFGGAVAVNAAAGSISGMAAIPFEKIVLIAAPNAMQDLVNGFAEAIALPRKAKRTMEAEVHRVTGTPLSEFVGAQQLGALATPTLVIHAPDDREVPYADALAYGAAGGHVSLMTVPGLGHRRILADEPVIRAAANFAVSGEAPRRTGHVVLLAEHNQRTVRTVP